MPCRDRVETSNPAIPHGHGQIRPGHFTPFAKNPTLSKFFMQMGRGEELGSGVLNVNRYLPFYTKGGKPRFVEGDPFVTIIPLPSEGGDETEASSSVKTSVKTSVKILEILRVGPTLSIPEMSQNIGVTPRSIERNISALQQAGRLRRVGPDKGGHWEVVEVTKG